MGVEAVIATQVIDTTTVGRSLMTAADAAAARTAISFDESVDDRVSALLVAGTNITITYNDAANTLTIAASGGGLSGTGSVDNAALRADGTGGATLQNSAWIINDNLTASPNNTVNHACIQATGATTNVSISLKPKGSGSFSLHAPDATATGGNVRGANAVDLQTLRSGASQVASATGASLLGGSGNTLSGTYGAGGGLSTTVSGIYAFGWARSSTISGQHAAGFGYGNTVSGDGCLGAGRFNTIGGNQSAGFGYYNVTSADFCLTAGLWALSNKYGQRSHASGRFAARGDAQGSEIVVRNSTSNGTQTELFLNGSSLRITIPTDTTWLFSAAIAARRTDADNESAAYVINGCIDNNAGTTALVGSPTVTVIAEDTAAWDAVAEADNTNDALVLKVTGESAKTIRWVGWVRLVEVTG